MSYYLNYRPSKESNLVKYSKLRYGENFFIDNEKLKLEIFSGMVDKAIDRVFNNPAFYEKPKKIFFKTKN